MPPFGESVLERMSSEYYELTSSEKKIVDYIMQHRMETQDMSISQLAERAAWQRPRSPGSAGGWAARATAHSAWPWPIPPPGGGRIPTPCPGKCWRMIPSGTCARSFTRRTWGPMAQTLELIRPEDIRAAADLLAAAGKVLCMGQGGSMIIAMEAAHLFSTTMGSFSPSATPTPRLWRRL